MNVVAFNGSPRKDGNTSLMLETVCKALQEEGIETELVHLADGKVGGCIACGRCYERKDGRCAVTTDPLNDYLDKMKAADGILFGSPTYFSGLTPELKALMDRSFYVARANGHLFRRKVGAAVVAVRRAGSIHVFDSINHFFLIAQMIVPGSTYWNMGFGKNKGEVEGDEEGMDTMVALGKNMAWLMKRL